MARSSGRAASAVVPAIKTMPALRPVPPRSNPAERTADLQRKENYSMSHHYSGPDFGFPQGDARLDFTDLYAFPKPGENGKSILIINVHPSAGENPSGPTTTEPFAPEALYELKIDTDGDAVADIAYRVRFSAFERGAQTASVGRVDGPQAAGTGDGGKMIVERAQVSLGRDAKVTEAADPPFFSGCPRDPFFSHPDTPKHHSKSPATH